MNRAVKPLEKNIPARCPKRDKTMRDPSRAASDRQRADTPRSDAPEPVFLHPEIIRHFNPDEMDMDDLTSVIQALLRSSGRANRDATAASDPDLLLPRSRATHVVGSGAAEPS
jgi:hypothetical protein